MNNPVAISTVMDPLWIMNGSVFLFIVVSLSG